MSNYNKQNRAAENANVNFLENTYNGRYLPGVNDNPGAYYNYGNNYGYNYGYNNYNYGYNYGYNPFFRTRAIVPYAAVAAAPAYVRCSCATPGALPTTTFGACVCAAQPQVVAVAYAAPVTYVI